MIGKVLDTPLYFLVLGLLCGVVGTRLGWRSRNRFGLPLLQGLVGALGFAASWRARGAPAGALAVGGWACGATLIGVWCFAEDPDRADRLVLRARDYRHAMLEWLRSGRGFAPWSTAGRHLGEVVAFAAAAMLTANVAGIVAGALLLNQMNAWVARLLAAAHDRRTVGLLAWNVWSVVRVGAYAMLGSACAAPLAARLGWPADPGQARRLAAAGVLGAVADLGLKLTLSAAAGRRLARAVDLDRVD